MTASEMIERVGYSLAKACADFYGDRLPETFDTELSFILARAAILAMREPTEAMVYEGQEVELRVSSETIVAQWQAMIDEALK